MGDDTRKWGPPFRKDADGNDTSESAYYLSTNRNKRSVALDISRPEGREVLLRLLEGADVFIENFKVGDMARYGLAWDALKERFPRLVYASVRSAERPVGKEVGRSVRSRGTPEP